MLISKSASYSRYLFKFRYQSVSALKVIRCTSNVPQKSQGEPTIQPIEEINWDPVPQKLLKRLRVEHHGIEPSKFDDNTIWYPIYKFPYLGKLRALIRFKVYITFISIGACLMETTKYLMGVQSMDYSILLPSITLFGMYLLGNLSRKIICQIYVTEDSKFVRLTRLTFFGRRQDIVLDKSLLIPLADSNETHRLPILNLEIMMPENINLEYDNYEFYDENFYIILIFGGISKIDKFESILGKLLRRKH